MRFTDILGLIILGAVIAIGIIYTIIVTIISLVWKKHDNSNRPRE